MESNGAIKIAGAMYNLETGVVDFFAGQFNAGETNASARVGSIFTGCSTNPGCLVVTTMKCGS
jgi:hypothetical protein